MKDLQVKGNDLVLENGDFKIISGEDEILQSLERLEFPQNVISKRIYCSEVPICRFFESLRMAVLKIEALE